MATPERPSAPAALTDYEGACLDRGADERAIRDVLTRVGDKWSLLVVATLRGGRLRFTELRTHIPGISQRMLTLTLRQLERDGLLVRTVHAEVPPRVEYELTPMGASLVDASIALLSWAMEHQSAIERSRAAYDAR
ncbi:MAG: transcriptional regulator [Leifsonia xyli]|nr:MAG: transcriptional regulator [Leifsonia xyli]